MFGFSLEHLIILIVILLIAGPKRLPTLANNLGRALKNFKDSVNGVDEAKFRHIDEENTANEKKHDPSSQPDSSPKKEQV